MRRKLKLLDLVLMGVGLVIGAGIYALVGESALLAGQGLWLSFLIGAISVGFTAVSLADLSTRYPLDASIYEYCKKAFDNDLIGFIGAWALAFAAISLASTVALGFGQYLGQLFAFPEVGGALVVLVIVTIINILGIELTVGLNAIITILEVFGLLLIIAIGLAAGPMKGAPMEMMGVMKGAALAFFAYTGFEAIIVATEEAENPKEDIPKAIFISLAICIVLYILVSISVLNIATPEQIVTAPLATVANIASGSNLAAAIALIALLSTGNTVLLSIYETSRVLYGMAEEKALPKVFMKMNRFEVPQYTILLSLVVAVLFSFTGIVFAAQVTNGLLLFVFILSNLAVVSLNYNNYKDIMRIPPTAVLGVLSSVGLLIFIDLGELVVAGGILLIGLLVYFAKRLIVRFKK